MTAYNNRIGTAIRYLEQGPLKKNPRRLCTHGDIAIVAAEHLYESPICQCDIGNGVGNEDLECASWKSKSQT